MLGHSESPRARTVAARALGVAVRTLRDLPGTLAAFNQAIDIADRAGLTDERAFAQVLLAGAQFLAGEPERSLELLNSAIPDLDGEQLLLARMQAGIVRGLSGDFVGGLTALDAIGDEVESLTAMRQGMYHTNRASCLLGVSRAAEAIEAFEHALRLYEEANEPHLASNALHNLARAYAAAGQVVGALRCFERIDGLGIGSPSGVDLVDRASVFLSAGLLDEAEESARKARSAALADETDFTEWRPVASMILAQTLEALGDGGGAVTPAREAMAMFEQQERPNLSDLAEAVELRGLATMDGGDQLADRTQATADRLSEWGAATDALALLLGVARRCDDASVARPLLETALTAGAAGAESNLLIAEAQARLSVLDDDIDRMSAVIAEGFESLDEWRRTIGSTELQARLSRQGVHLADVGVGVAIQRSDASAVLEIVERLRALSLVSTIDGPRNEELDRLLVEYRALGGHLETGDHQEARARLERRIRELGRLADDVSPALEQPELDVALDQLGDRKLVEFVSHGGSIFAVTATAGSTIEMTEIERSAGELLREIDSLRSAITRLSSPQTSPAARDAFTTVLDAAAGFLSTWLFGSIELGDDSPVVIVPSRSLGSLPWSALPALASRPLTVAPSVRLWANLKARTQRGNGEVIAVGLDDPPFALAEARMIAEMRGGTAILGDQALAEPVLRHIDGTSVGHLACHGFFRGDNPLMSSLSMADGPITVYDFERLVAPPETLVLSACEVARSQRLAGDALLGMTASLMAAGTRSIVAATTVVSDEVAPELMTEWHRQHHAGATPAEALAGARQVIGDEPSRRAVAASFLCLGI